MSGRDAVMLYWRASDCEFHRDQLESVHSNRHLVRDSLGTRGERATDPFAQALGSISPLS